MRELVDVGQWLLSVLDWLCKAGGLLFVVFLVANFFTYYRAVQRGEIPGP